MQFVSVEGGIFGVMGQLCSSLFRLFFSESKKPFLERVSNTQAV